MPNLFLLRPLSPNAFMPEAIGMDTKKCKQMAVHVHIHIHTHIYIHICTRTFAHLTPKAVLYQKSGC